MKITLNEVRGMQAGLGAILGKELPVKTAYWLTRFLDKIESEMKAIEKTRVKLLERLATKDEKGKSIMISKKDNGNETSQYDLTKSAMKEFQKQFAELGEEKLIIDLKAIKLKQLGDIKLKPIVLLQLGKIIEK